MFLEWIYNPLLEVSLWKKKREFELTCYVCWDFIGCTDNEEEAKRIQYCSMCEGTTIKETIIY
jgi:hypothetical protein